MSVVTDFLAAVSREVDEAALRAQRVAHVRITPLALPGSIVAVTITPERARTVCRPLMLETQAVVPDVEWERTVEILIHPKDYEAFLIAERVAGNVTRLLGLRVVA